MDSLHQDENNGSLNDSILFLSSNWSCGGVGGCACHQQMFGPEQGALGREEVGNDSVCHRRFVDQNKIPVLDIERALNVSTSRSEEIQRRRIVRGGQK